MRQRRGARLVVVAILTGLVSGALLAPGASASTTARASAGAAAPPTAVASAFYCGKFWKTRTMNGEKLTKFVKKFKKSLKAGRDIAAAFGVASSTTGIGPLPGVALAVVAKFGGDFIINFVFRKLTKSLDTYRRVGIKVGVKCKWGGIPYPEIGFHGKKW